MVFNWRFHYDKATEVFAEFKDQVVLETISGAMTQVGFRFKVIDMVHAGADLARQKDDPECHLDLVTAVPGGVWSVAFLIASITNPLL
jgi:hypothetical protein